MFFRTFIFVRNFACFHSVGKNKSVFWCVCSICASVRTDCAVGLPGWTKKKDVLRLWQVNHLSFQSQTADLHPRQLVLVLYSLHIQQALLSGLQHTYEYFIICSPLNLPQNWAPVQLTLYNKFVCVMCIICQWRALVQILCV